MISKVIKACWIFSFIVAVAVPAFGGNKFSFSRQRKDIPNRLDLLPVDLQLEVFNYLDSESLMNSTQRSVAYKDIIHSLPVLHLTGVLKITEMAQNIMRQKKFKSLPKSVLSLVQTFEQQEAKLILVNERVLFRTKLNTVLNLLAKDYVERVEQGVNKSLKRRRAVLESLKTLPDLQTEVKRSISLQADRLNQEVRSHELIRKDTLNQYIINCSVTGMPFLPFNISPLGRL